MLLLSGVTPEDAGTPPGAPHVVESVTVKRRDVECSQQLVRYEETCILGNGSEARAHDGGVGIDDFWAHELVDCGAEFSLCGQTFTCRCLKVKPPRR